MAKFGVTLVLLALCAASAAGQAVVEDAIVVDQTQFPVLEKPVQVNLVDEELNMMPSDEHFDSAEDAVEPASEDLDAVYNELDAVEPAFEELDAARPVAETNAVVETNDDKAIQKEEGMPQQFSQIFMPQQFSQKQIQTYPKYITDKTTPGITEETPCTTPQKTTSKITPRTTTFLATPRTTTFLATPATTLINNPRTTQSIAEDVQTTTTKFRPYGKMIQCDETFFTLSDESSCQQVVSSFLLAKECGGENRVGFIGTKISGFCQQSCKYSKLYGMWLGNLEPEVPYYFHCISRPWS